jgi:hypothetical protein
MIWCLSDPLIDHVDAGTQLLHMFGLTLVQDSSQCGLLVKTCSAPRLSQRQVRSKLRVHMTDRTAPGEHAHPQVKQGLLRAFDVHRLRKAQTREHRCPEVMFPRPIAQRHKGREARHIPQRRQQDARLGRHGVPPHTIHACPGNEGIVHLIRLLSYSRLESQDFCAKTWSQ